MKVVDLRVTRSESVALNVLVTGATGFLGKALVLCLSNLIDDRRFRLIAWRGRSDGNFLRHSDRAEILRKYRPDTVIHCAWHSTATTNYEHSANHESWVDATVDFASQCEHLVKHFILIGSAVDKPRVSSGHLRETAYSNSKQLLQHILIEKTKHTYDLSWISPQYIFSQSELRPRIIRDLVLSSDPNNFISSFPNEEHDYIHLYDVTEAIRTVLVHEMLGIIYVGSGLLLTNSDFVAITKFNLGFTAVRPYINTRVGEFSPDSLLSKGWNPAFSNAYFGLQ